jgi:hypothetical protein
VRRQILKAKYQSEESIWGIKGSRQDREPYEEAKADDFNKGTECDKDQSLNAKNTEYEPVGTCREAKQRKKFIVG